MTESKFVNGFIEAAVMERDLLDTRRFLIRLLLHRFSGEITPQVIDTINAQPSRTVLEDWFDQACTVPSFADFVRALRTVAPAS